MKPLISPSAEWVTRFRRATGLGVVESKRFLMTEPGELSERILRAFENQRGGSHLRDPIEVAPETAPIVAAAFARAEIEVDAAFGASYFRGRCHAIWPRVARTLREFYGIEWFSPARMNPGVCFD